MGGAADIALARPLWADDEGMAANIGKQRHLERRGRATLAWRRRKHDGIARQRVVVVASSYRCSMYQNGMSYQRSGHGIHMNNHIRCGRRQKGLQ